MFHENISGESFIVQLVSTLNLMDEKKDDT